MGIIIGIAIGVVLVVMVFAAEFDGTGTYNPGDSSGWDPLDPADPYNDCPDCGSGDTDGNHCYDCNDDF